MVHGCPTFMCARMDGWVSRLTHPCDPPAQHPALSPGHTRRTPRWRGAGAAGQAGGGRTGAGGEGGGRRSHPGWPASPTPAGDPATPHHHRHHHPPAHPLHHHTADRYNRYCFCAPRAQAPEPAPVWTAGRGLGALHDDHHQQQQPRPLPAQVTLPRRPLLPKMWLPPGWL